MDTDCDSDLGSRRAPWGRVGPLLAVVATRRRASVAGGRSIDADPYAACADSEALDRRRLCGAALIAAAAHALLLLVQLPAVTRIESAAADRPVLHVLRTFRFAPPEVAHERQLPPQRVRRMPMPDPTPDGPEPLPALEGLPVALDAVDVPSHVPARAPEPTAPDPRYREVLPVGGDVQMPVKVYAPAPAYPEPARRARVQGTVLVQAVIDRDGNVVSAEVVRGQPMGLNEAALEAVRQWRYEPATLRGRPVAVTFSLAVSFELQ